MPVYFNKETGLAEDVADHALQSGSHEIPLISPEGEHGSAPTMEDAQRLMQQGYRQPDQNELKALLTHAKYSQQPIKAGIEGLGRGILGPLATGAELAIGVKPEAILAREEANPKASMAGEATGLIGGAFTGTGEAAALELLGKAGAKQVTKHLGEGALAKVAATAAHGAIENAAFSASDEVSHMLLNDPAQSAATAATNIGLSGILGGAIGGGASGAKQLWSAKVGPKVGELLEGFKGRLAYHAETPDINQALTDELSGIHGALSGTKEAYGLRRQAVEGLFPKEAQAHANILEQSSRIGDELSQTIASLQKQEGMAGVASKLEQDLHLYQEQIRQGSGTPGSVYDAVNELKQKMQKHEFKYAEDFGAADRFKPFANKLRTSTMEMLEDNKLWGEAADLHKGLNKAYAKFKTPLEEFEHKFTSELNGERVIDPGKVQTIMNQTGKAQGEIKRSMLANFFDEAERYKGEVRGLHSRLGLDTAHLDNISDKHTRQLLGKYGTGEALADALVKKGIHEMLGGALGGVTGAAFGHPFIGMLLGKEMGGPMLKKLLPALAPALAKADSSAIGFKSAITYAANVAKGEARIKDAVGHVFGAGKLLAIPRQVSTEALQMHLDKIAQNPKELQDNVAGIGHYMPDHAEQVAAQASSAVLYLESLRPHAEVQSPLDKPREPSAIEKARYQNALIIAENPLSIMHKVKNGALTQQDMQDMEALHPGLLDKLRFASMEQLINAKQKKQSVPYATQMGLTLLLGQPLASSFKQQNMLMTQMSFIPPMPATGGGRAPSATSMQGLSKMPMSLSTPEQATANRRQNRSR